MEILYVTSVPSPKEFDRMKTVFKSGFIYGMNESGFKFHTLILDGMRTNKDVNITSLVGRSVSHSTHKGVFWKGIKERVSENLVYEHIPLINLPILKHISVGISLFFKTRKFIKNCKDKQAAIVMDASYITANPFIVAAAGKKCHKTAIFCDIYYYMADVADARENSVGIAGKLARKIANYTYSRLDSFVLLTEQMNSVVNKSNKPYIVMEGLVDINMQTAENTLDAKSKDRAVMYAGALRAQYGLKNLVEGFMAYKNENVKLWIFGDGDYIPDIKNAAEKDNRIIFGGTVPLSEAVKKELEATVLVNSRPTDMEFAKYSFPSKNMEYMVSGTPVLTTRLTGMPQEYYDYIFTIDGNTAQDVTTALEKVFSLSDEQLYSMGAKAKKFVLENKNNLVQSGRILSLIGYKGKGK